MKESIKFLIPLVLAADLRIFVASRGTYGFITDHSGSRVMSFGLRLHFGGNYRAVNRGDGRFVGQGWRITDSVYPESSMDIQNLFNESAMPPSWATNNKPVRIVTLDQHLKDYQWSSNYTEVEQNDS